MLARQILLLLCGMGGERLVSVCERLCNLSAAHWIAMTVCVFVVMIITKNLTVDLLG